MCSEYLPLFHPFIVMGRDITLLFSNYEPMIRELSPVRMLVAGTWGRGRETGCFRFVRQEKILILSFILQDLYFSYCSSL